MVSEPLRLDPTRVEERKTKEKENPSRWNPNPIQKREKMKKTHRSASGSPAKDVAVTAASILSIPIRTDWGIGKISPREGQRESTQKKRTPPPGAAGKGRRQLSRLTAVRPPSGARTRRQKGQRGAPPQSSPRCAFGVVGGSRDGKSREEKWRWGASRAAVPRRRTPGRRSAAAARGEERPPACGTEERREMRPSF